MEKDLLHGRVSVTLHAVVAILVGYFSFWINNNLYAGLLGLVLLVVMGYPLERFTGKRGLKWWFANGIFIYLMLWLVSWTYFLNV